MPLRKQKGNMYAFVTHTWNPIKGKCAHDCSYCYMKRFPQRSLRLDEKELETDLGKGNFIFVGSSTDVFAEDVPHEWIYRILETCDKFPENTYLFQSKNPRKLISPRAPHVFGTTLETGREDLIEKYSSAPSIKERVRVMNMWSLVGHRIMITVEPIMTLAPAVEVFAQQIFECHPEWVNVGADSGGNHLPEPGKSDIDLFLRLLRQFTTVRLKENLKRLYP